MPNGAATNLYVESSAALAWLLGEPRGQIARGLLAEATRVITSDLTLIECERVLIRAETLGELSATGRRDLAGVLRTAAAGWHLLRVSDEVVDRARQPFPHEPYRTLDAIHLASALVARSAIRRLVVLSYDERIRAGARGLGFDVVPA